MAGGRESLDPQASGLERALHDGHGVAPQDLRVARDVVGIGVRRQEMRDGEGLARDSLEERIERRAAVDEDGGATGPVGDEIGVREPARVHAPVDQHAR